MFTKKFFSAIFAATVFCSSVYSQALFTYGTKTVNKDEFLKAFNKNPDTTGSRTEKIKQYLDMYVNFKLKIQAAKDEKLNLSEMYKSESENFRSQLTDNYINEQADINALVQEAFNRSQKDILLSHVFIEVKPGADTTEAYKQIKDAYDALQGGKEFGIVASTFSSDDATKKANGAIGYITAFTLPYEIENTVYALQPGTFSNIYRSNAGYHIFKNISERPAVGKRKVQQILMATPAGFSEGERKETEELADSVYKELQNGASFEKMQQLYGTVSESAGNAGSTEVGVGQYSSDFENAVFSLQKSGDISKPFTTEYGYHILKLTEIIPVSKDENDVINRAHLQELVQEDNRLSASKDALLQKWMVETKYTAASYSAKDLWSYTDSSLTKSKPLAAYKNFTPQTSLFSFAKQKITAANWLQFVIEAKQTGATYANKDYPTIMKEFTKSSCDKYYRSHIEDYYPPIAAQVAEFNEANLLFAVMDKHVWSKAAEDSAGLKKYYTAHKQQYTWQPGVSALIVSASSKDILDSVAVQLKNNSSSWRSIATKYSSTLSADSSRFENGQLPLKQEIKMEKGFISQPEQNENSDAYTMVYVFEVFTQPAPRMFDDAHGMVINDYQQVLEEKWISALKLKYPVKINEGVVKTL
ncbi:MAG: peptidylprolyl isomerase [Panacibacter sp.]